MSRALLLNTLVNDSALTTLVGSNIWALVIPPEEDAPAVTYQRVVRAPENHLNGPATLDRDRWQINSWALDIDTADSIAIAVREALEAQNFILDFEIDARYESDTRRIGIRQDYYHHQQR